MLLHQHHPCPPYDGVCDVDREELAHLQVLGWLLGAVGKSHVL